MCSLFPAMAEDLRRQAAKADALARRLDYQESLRRPPCRQKALLTGMDCLAGQQDLFATDGPPDMTRDSRACLGRLGPECLPPGDSGEGKARPTWMITEDHEHE